MKWARIKDFEENMGLVNFISQPEIRSWIRTSCQNQKSHFKLKKYKLWGSTGSKLSEMCLAKNLGMIIHHDSKVEKGKKMKQYRTVV